MLKKVTWMVWFMSPHIHTHTRMTAKMFNAFFCYSHSIFAQTSSIIMAKQSRCGNFILVIHTICNRNAFGLNQNPNTQHSKNKSTSKKNTHLIWGFEDTNSTAAQQWSESVIRFVVKRQWHTKKAFRFCWPLACH